MESWSTYSKVRVMYSCAEVRFPTALSIISPSLCPAGESQFSDLGSQSDCLGSDVGAGREGRARLSHSPYSHHQTNESQDRCGQTRDRLWNFDGGRRVI